MSKKDEALKLALDYLEPLARQWGIESKAHGVCIAIREALASEANERCVCGEPDTPGTHRTDGPCLAEQPAQIDPSAGTQMSKVWWDGDKLMAQPIPLDQFYTSPPASKPLTDKAKAVIDAARAAMDDSVEAYDSEGSIKISSHLAASLSLCLDEYDRAIEAANAKGDA